MERKLSLSVVIAVKNLIRNRFIELRNKYGGYIGVGANSYAFSAE